MGTLELIVILAIILLLAGSTQIPKLAHSLGKSVTIFKKAVKEGEDEVTVEETGEVKK